MNDSLQVDWSGVHPAIPITREMAREIVTDALQLYPEALAVSVVGTYSRVNETPSPKSHDVDILIRFPELTEGEYRIRMRDDTKLWTKWRKRSPVTIDFLMRFGEQEPHYGHHQERLENGLPTPEAIIWSQPLRETITTA